MVENGTTACAWDTVIPFAPLWEAYKRIIKPNGAIVLFGSEPFASYLRLSNIAGYKYDWSWNKHRAGNFFAAGKRPLNVHENILIFGQESTVFNSQMWQGEPYSVKQNNDGSQIGAYGKQKRQGITQNDGARHPISCLSFGTPANNGKLHPTQKPVPLLEFLIRTYTNTGETVLDSCFGSGTTAIACMRTGRKFIGIERDDAYFKICVERVRDEQQQGRLFTL